MAEESNETWEDIRKMTERSGPMAGPGFDPSSSPSPMERLRTSKVLVVGAGGLGCEILKDLALSGFGNLTVIDMDTVDYSNLNRQFLFRLSDVGTPKAVAAAQFVMKRVPSCTVTPVVGALQTKDSAWYRQFEVVVSGLDSVPARRWLNFTLCGLVTRDDQSGELDASTVIPMIDAGTEGWKGHARVILPKFTACFECAVDAFPPQITYPVCTIASEPRLPEHCVQYASEVVWPVEHKGEKLDMDQPEHVEWVLQVASRRAQEKGIQGVTRSLVLGVVKNIMPAIAATNATIAAAVSLEAFKYVTGCSGSLDNYMMYNGASGVYTYTFEHERKESCMACGVPKTSMTVSPDIKLADLISLLASEPTLQLNHPSLTMPGKNLYMRSPEPLRIATEPNLEKTLESLGIHDGTEITVSDQMLPIGIILELHFQQ